MTIGTFDCRSYDLPSYAYGILKNRIERFSTVYACCFITAADAAVAAGTVDVRGEGQAATDMLITASSTGELRLYRLPDLMQKWSAAAPSATSALQSSEAACSSSWLAHHGAAYCLVKMQAGGDLLVLSGGDDGYVRGWRLSDVMRYLQARSQQKTRGEASGTGLRTQPGLQQLQQVSELTGATVSQAGPTACFAVRMPRAEGPLAASSLPPAVQALAPGNGSSTVAFAGCSDGGVHCLDLSSGNVSYPSGPGHVAGVLAMDLHGPGSCLATGSEDGTVRIWDTRVGLGTGPGSGSRCVRVLDSSAGCDVACGGAEVLRCLRNPPVTCLRFDQSGSWLLCGHGGSSAGGSLSMWNLSMAQRARQALTSFVPQAMEVQPAEVLVVGNEASLSRYSLALEGPTQQPLATRSVFALDVHPLTGAVAVGGVGASLELLSKYGKRTGGLAYVSGEE